MDYDKQLQDVIRQQKVNILTLKRLKVLDERGEEVPFQSFLDEKLVTIIFIRHFGCIACRAHVDQVWNLQKDNKNNRIIFIGSGEPYIIEQFKADMNVQDAEIYTDPTLETFDACGMERGILKLMNIRSLGKMRELKKKGYSQGAFKDTGSHRQMGGVVIFKYPGKLAYHFASEYLGDFDGTVPVNPG